MSDAAIWVEGFNTGYCIGPRERYKALRDVITEAFVAPFRRLRENSPFAIRNSRCLSGCLPPSADCLLPCRPLTFHAFRLSALRFPDSPFLRFSVSPCPSVPQNEQVNEGNNVPQIGRSRCVTSIGIERRNLS